MGAASLFRPARGSKTNTIPAPTVTGATANAARNKSAAMSIWLLLARRPHAVMHRHVGNRYAITRVAEIRWTVAVRLGRQCRRRGYFRDFAKKFTAAGSLHAIGGIEVAV